MEEFLKGFLKQANVVTSLTKALKKNVYMGGVKKPGALVPKNTPKSSVTNPVDSKGIFKKPLESTVKKPSATHRDYLKNIGALN